MKIVDVISVVKSGIAQLTAANYFSAETPVLTETDTSAIVELGKSFDTYEKAPDIFLKALVDTLSVMRIDSRRYTAVLPSLFVDTYEWGGFREHVVIGLSDILADEMYPVNGFIDYNAEGGDDEAIRIAGLEHGTFKPSAESKFYDEGKPFMVALSTVREQLFTAVKSDNPLRDLNKILSGMQTSVDNTIQLEAEVTALYTVSTGAARALALDNEIPLVSMYNSTRANSGTITNTTTFTLVTTAPQDWSTTYTDYYMLDSEGIIVPIPEGESAPTFAELTVYSAAIVPTNVSVVIPTGERALDYPEFVSFMLETIANVKDEFKCFSAAYNNHQHVTFSDDTRLILLAKVANRAKFGVRANTFNEELLGIGDFEKISSWQAKKISGGKQFDFNALSSIAMTKAAATKVGLTVPAGATGITLKNIIGVVYDRYAMGVSLDKRKVTSNYIAVQDKINTYHHLIKNMIIDDNFPMAVFTLN